jgi:peptidoglycan/LPS O-acetylase OafA/YrhL
MDQRPLHFAALDGVRALAIATVVAFHADLVVVPGGFIGVEVFFVLSGFLVGGSIFRELTDTGQLDLKRYASRRARRLIPALVAMLVMSSLVVLVAFPGELIHLRQGLVGAVTGTSNWTELYFSGDYFSALGRGPILRHLWSFAVEVQAYALLPPLIVLTSRLRSKQSRPNALATSSSLACLGLMSYAWQAVLHSQTPTSSRAYFGTDTRFGAIAMGAALAVALQRKRGPIRSGFADVTGAAALGVVGALCVVMEGTDQRVHQGGLLLLAVSSCVLLWSVTAGHNGAIIWMLTTRPMRWLGTRSYGVYLWHWPVFVLTRPIMGEPMPVLPLLARLALTAALAEASHRFIETPFLRPTNSTTTPRQSHRRALELAAAALTGCLIGGIATASPVDAPPPWQVTTQPVSTPTAPTLIRSVETSLPVPRLSIPTSTTHLPPTPLISAPTIDGSQLTLIGDSVMMAALPSLQERFGESVTVDAEVGRQFGEATKRVADLRVVGRLNPIVVIGLGTNGPFTDKQIDELITELSDRQLIVFVLVNAPRRWERKVNEALRKAQERHPSIVLVDWPGLVETEQLRLADGIHPAPKAAAAYTALILQAIADKAP